MTITHTAAPAVKLELALPGPERLAALATAEAELSALDGASVERPLSNPAELMSEALDFVAAGRETERSLAEARHDAAIRRVGT